MVLDKYISINDNKILVGQYPSTGAWYCKELPAKDSVELKKNIGDVIIVLNYYNNEVKEVDAKQPSVRGVKL
jgi:hypothetical protein